MKKLTAMLLLTLVLSGCGTSKPTTVEPVPTKVKVVEKQPNKVVKENKPKKVLDTKITHENKKINQYKYLFIGDSVFEEMSKYATRDCKFITRPNATVPGQKREGIFYNLEGEMYEHVYLFFGYNDIKSGDLTKFLEDYKEYICYLQTRFSTAVIHIVSLPPVPNGKCNSYYEKANEELEKLRDRATIEFIDTSYFPIKWDEVRTEDGIHFTPEGYKQFFRFLTI